MHDTVGTGAPVLISQAMARQFWPGEQAVGKRFRISFTPEIVRQVVGVVGDVKERGLDVLEPLAVLYVPLRQDEQGGVSLVVRGGGQMSGLVPAITRVLNGINPELPVKDVLPMDEIVATSLSQHRFSMYLFVALAALAFLLAAVGIYSVISYSVRGRAQEIGVRIALGAGPRDVLRMVVGEAMRPALLGLGAGAMSAYALGGILSQLIFGVSPADPITFSAAAVLLAAVALAACALPAYRATRTDPLEAIRGE